MPNFFLSYKRAEVAGRMLLETRERHSRAGFEADAPRYGQRTAGFSDEVAAGDQQSGKNAQGLGALAGATAMKLFTTWVVSAGLVLAATAADAQVLAPRGTGSAGYAAVSDVDGPYAAVPEGAPVRGYGPTLLPAPEVYTVLRENGFSPLGAPQLRGVVYTIAVMDRRGRRCQYQGLRAARLRCRCRKHRRRVPQSRRHWRPSLLPSRCSGRRRRSRDRPMRRPPYPLLPRRLPLRRSPRRKFSRRNRCRRRWGWIELIVIASRRVARMRAR